MSETTGSSKSDPMEAALAVVRAEVLPEVHGVPDNRTAEDTDGRDGTQETEETEETEETDGNDETDSDPRAGDGRPEVVPMGDYR
ncbi:MAG: hypothetical protein ACLP2J_07040, partial [Acidimicrobiales bacterium]